MQNFKSPVGLLIEYGDKNYFSDNSTLYVAEHLEIPFGAVVAEPGCGSGMLSVLAAKLGASCVYATDIDPSAIEYTSNNATANLTSQVKALHGSLLEPIPKDICIDVVVAILPHRPSPTPFNARFYGGWDGTDLIMSLLDQCEARLKSGALLYLYHNSIANPDIVNKRLEELFFITVLGARKRYFTKEEFENVEPGIFEHLFKLRELGKSCFNEDSFEDRFNDNRFGGDKFDEDRLGENSSLEGRFDEDRKRYCFLGTLYKGTRV